MSVYLLKKQNKTPVTVEKVIAYPQRRGTNFNKKIKNVVIPTKTYILKKVLKFIGSFWDCLALRHAEAYFDFVKKCITLKNLIFFFQ